ncbi:DedA family protein [Natronococcus occultus]|uniref:Putative membrane-associated protein n=1 Tax=Natronococcus occultus SP4 TaxID=694430 RepID=L0K2L4_9EURY|nr:VTT domain-containing protein [Natronococcus occultus]AGB38604.1 putative membrane-associated protein [Natronococcus occultus SP4]
MIGTTAASVEALQAAIRTFGLPVLFGVFVLKGALVGKVFPTSVFLPGYVVGSGLTGRGAALVVVVVTVAHVLGQLALYLGVRRYGWAVLEGLPYVELDPQSERYRRLDRWFERYGGVAIFTTNIVPVSRGVIAVPAALSSYSTARYTLHTSIATVLYHGVYVGAAVAGVALLT